MINLIAPINTLGYGYTGYNIALALSKKIAVHLDVIGKPECHDNIEIIQALIHNNFGYDAPCIRIWHQHDLKYFVGGKKIGFPIFELDTFTERELYHLNYCDRLFTCSKWGKEILKNNGLKCRIDVIPLGVDRKIFYEGRQEESTYVFLTCGKWEKRKGHDHIIRAFNSVFSEGDDVELWMMCENSFISEEQRKEWEGLVKNSKLASKIRLIPRLRSYHDVARLMRMSSCGVFPSLGEGWGLPILEMLACGKPVITTFYSGHTEFCNDHNSFLIDIDELELAYDDPFFYGQGRWAKFGDKQFQQLCDYMAHVYTENIRENHNLTASKFTWDNTANRILEVI